MADPRNYAASGAQALPPREAGVSEMLDIQLKRLSEIAGRLESVCDTIYGPTPQAAGTDPNAGPMASIASRTRDLAEMVSRIDSATGRIQTGL